MEALLVPIAIGDRIPDVEVRTMTESGPTPVQTGELLGTGRVVLFGLPGAFTPTCSDHHLPGYVMRAEELKAKGVDAVYCVSVNDAFVMGAWGNALEVGTTVTLLADGNGTLTQALDLVMDGTGFGLGLRSQRFAMVIEEGVVTLLNIETKGGSIEESGVEAVLSAL